MTRIVPILGLTLAGLLCTAADAPSVSETFGNTIMSTYPDGRTAELWLAQDGTYTAEGRRHDPSNGHWRAKGVKLCLKQSRPVAVPISFCTPLPSGKMSDGWTGKAVSGEKIQIKLVKGHVTGPA
jgi:hypothetical protein